MFEHKDYSKGSLYDFLNYVIEQAVGKEGYNEILTQANSYYDVVNYTANIKYEDQEEYCKKFLAENTEHIQLWHNQIRDYLIKIGYTEDYYKFGETTVDSILFSARAWAYELFHRVLQVLKRNIDFTKSKISIYVDNGFSLPS